MLLTNTTSGASPLSTVDAVTFLKQASGADDTLIAALVAVATEFCEEFSGRSTRSRDFELLVDGFGETGCIELPVADIDSVTSVEYLVSGAFVAIASSVWQAKVERFSSFVTPRDGQSWPTNIDTAPHNVRVTFDTTALRQVLTAVGGIQRHLAALYVDRGDMEGPSSQQDPGNLGSSASVYDSARQSGAIALYQTFAVPGI